MWRIVEYLSNTVVPGGVQACDVVAEIAKPEFKARMTVKLAVAGAFHTDYMAPAVDKLKEALASTAMTTPRLPVISNVDAQPHSDPDTIKDILARQVRDASYCWHVEGIVPTLIMTLHFHCERAHAPCESTWEDSGTLCYWTSLCSPLGSPFLTDLGESLNNPIHELLFALACA